jgi:hypothetical protein
MTLGKSPPAFTSTCAALEYLFSGAIGDGRSDDARRIAASTEDGTILINVLDEEGLAEVCLTDEWCEALVDGAPEVIQWARAARFCSRSGAVQRLAERRPELAEVLPTWRSGLRACIVAGIATRRSELLDAVEECARAFAVFLARRCIRVDGRMVSATFRSHAKSLIGPDVLCDVFGSSAGASAAVALSFAARGGIAAFVNGHRCDRGEHVDQLFAAIRAHAGAAARCGSWLPDAQSVRDSLAVVMSVSLPGASFTYGDDGLRTLTTESAKLGFHFDIGGGALRRVARASWLGDLRGAVCERAASRSAFRRRAREHEAALDLEPAARTLLVAHGEASREVLLCGISTLGRERTGTLLLHNLPPNIRRMSRARAMANAEILGLCEALGLTPYGHDAPPWRYGRVVVLSDRSAEGIQFCGLVLNALVTLSRRECAVSLFWLAPEGVYDPASEWLASPSDWAKRRSPAWRHCGSGAHFGGMTPAALRALFLNMEASLVSLALRESCEQALELFYGAKASGARREMVMRGATRRSLLGGCACSVGDFLHVEVSKTCVEHTIRALPSAVDGLTPAKRAVLRHFLRSTRSYAPTVTHAAAAILCSYPHDFFGDQSLSGAIVALAQRHVGAGNASLLDPLGLFGTRATGPSTHASERQLRVRLAKLTPFLFPDELRLSAPRSANLLLAHSVPVIPTVLLNGASGIAAGFSCACPHFSLPDLCAASRRALAGETLRPLTPSFAGFRGNVERCGNAVHTAGRFRRDGLTVTITELPVGRWTEHAVEHYRSLTRHGEPRLARVLDRSTEREVHIELELLREPASDDDLAAVLHLTSSFTLEQLWMLDDCARLRRYASPEEIVQEHARVRLESYRRRTAEEQQGARLDEDDASGEAEPTSPRELWAADLLALETAFGCLS